MHTTYAIVYIIHINALIYTHSHTEKLGLGNNRTEETVSVGYSYGLGDRNPAGFGLGLAKTWAEESYCHP